MKTICYWTIALFVSFFQFIQAQVWTPLNVYLPDSFAVWDISIVNENVIWASASNIYLTDEPTNIPMFLVSTDGGNNWVVDSVPVAAGGAAVNIEALDDSIALLATHTLEGVASTRKIFKTDDQGNSWTLVSEADCGGWNLHFFDSHWIANCWQTGICYSNNQGDDWNSITNFPPSNNEGTNMTSTLTNNYPVVGDYLWFGSNKGKIIKSTDKGMSWNAIHIIDGYSKSPSLAFSDTLNGLCVFYNTNNSDLYQTNDGGYNWNEVIIPNSIVLQEITHVPGTDSTFVGISWGDPVRTVITCDYGANWEILDDSISVASLSFYSKTFGLVGDGTGVDSIPAIYKFNLEFDINDCATIVSTKSIDISNKIKVTPNPFTNQFFVDLGNLKAQELTLINASGQIVWLEQSNIQNQIEVTIPNLIPGIYFLKVKTKEGFAYKKLVKM